MKKFNSNTAKALAFSASALAFVIAGPVAAQDEQQEETTEEEEEEQVDVSTDASGSTSQQRGITVTGSRIVRDTYSSISPLQVLTTENQQSVGAFDPAQILQRSESAAGQQIDDGNQHVGELRCAQMRIQIVGGLLCVERVVD